MPTRILAEPGRLKLLPTFESAAEEFDIPVDLLMAMTFQESGWQSKVISEDGAVGIGQLLPSTSVWLQENYFPNEPNLNPFVAEDNIRMSARYLKWLFGYLETRESTNPQTQLRPLEERVMAGYYQGPGSILRREKGLFIDTEEYIASVNRLKRFFR